MNTSRCGSSRIRGWRFWCDSCRAERMSGRSCSLASSVLWDRPPLTSRRYSAADRRRGLMTKMPIAVLGIDLGKNSCSLAGLDASGAVVLRRRMTREGLVAFTAGLPSCIVAMEACCGAHFLQKTNDRDAEAIAEAATR